jgi:hypothetical protein
VTTTAAKAKHLAAGLLLCSIASAQGPAPKDGYVPSDKIAIEIAKAVLEGMYDHAFVTKQESFHAELHQSVWTVEGRFNRNPPNVRGGGGLFMRIDKNTGAILGYYFAR